MTGVYVVVVALVLTAAFGLYRRATDGKVRAAKGKDRLDQALLGAELGPSATFVQFSSEVCAPCRATQRVLSGIADADPRVAHVELDAAQRLDLVERYGITRTPTVLLLDSAGVVRHKIVGAVRRPDALVALEEVAGEAA